MSQHIVSAKIYSLIFAGLLVMTWVTYEVAQFDLGRLSVIVALTIATIKAVLVVLYFMHVRYSSRLTWVVVVSGFFWLAIMIGLTMSDYLTRPEGWMSFPR